MQRNPSLSASSMAFVLVPTLILGAFLRLSNLNKTGLEVDESANYDIARSIYDFGYPSMRPEKDVDPQLFLFHPNFGYKLMAAWFHISGPSLLNARILNVAVSLIVLILVFAFSKSFGRGTALLATFFTAFDSWIVLTNRMNYLENIQLLLIVTGIWLFWKAARSGDNLLLYIAAGATIGLAVIFKHIGVYLVLVVLTNWLLMRKHGMGHLATLLTIGIIVAAYVSWMYVLYGQIYLDQQIHQLDRLFGLLRSRGLNFGLLEAARIIVDRYWIFVTTVLALVLGWPLVAWRYIQNLLKKSRAADTIVLSWAFSGLVFAFGSQLKSPHYLILWLIPLFIFLAKEVVEWARGKRLLYVPILLAVFLIANIFTWNYRFVKVGGDTLRDTAAYVNTNLPADAVVATESYLGTLINQPYIRIDLVSSPQRLDQADYLAIYQSTTQTVEDLPIIIQMSDQYCDPVAQFQGFKDNVQLCRVDHDALRSMKLKPASAMICLVTDIKGINDRSYNASAWKGVTDAQARLGVAGAYLESYDDTYHDVNISAFIQGGCDLVVTMGSSIGEATATAAEAHPEQKFAVVDFDFFDFSVDPAVDLSYENVKEITFRAEEAAFLAGYIAAGVTRTGNVGTFGGLKNPTVTSVMDGFVLGVNYYNERHDTSVQVLGWDPILRIGLFTDTFDVGQKDTTLGEYLIAEGADIIMPVVDGVDLGTVAVAREHGDVYIIGVDTDWTVSAPEYSDVILTSVLKKMDVAVLNIIQDVINGTFQGSLYTGMLANDGVDLASFHNLDSLILDELKIEVEEVKADIIAGKIQTLP